MATLPVSLQGVGCPQRTPEWGQTQESPSTAFSLQGKRLREHRMVSDTDAERGSPQVSVAVGIATLQGEGWVHLLPALPSEGFPER